jgi:hypothetical protein
MKNLRLGGPIGLSSLWLAAVAGGCAGQCGAEVLEGPGGDVGGPDPGASECLADADCVQIVEDRLEPLRSAIPRQVAVVESRCEPMNVILDLGSASGPGCECELSDERTRILGPAGIGCSVLGRGGDCLFGDRSLPAAR